MSTSLASLCDPSTGDLAEAIRQAKVCAQGEPGFDVNLSRYLQACLAKNVQLPIMFRGLEVLEAVAEENKALFLLRPFLKSGDPQIASKCVLVLGRRCQTLGWIKSVMAEVDDRVRANLIESLWGRQEPEVELVMRSVLRDPNPRVAANATYGLHVLGSPLFPSAMDELLESEDAGHRRSAIWVIRSVGAPDAATRIKSLIRDTDPDVRRAAFQAMLYIRQNSAKTQPLAGAATAG